MTDYAIHIKKEDGFPFNGIVFYDDTMPPIETTPIGCEMIIFNEKTENFDLLYTILVDDSTGSASSYLPAIAGGVKYNFLTNKFEFVKAPPPPTLLDLIRLERDRLLKSTDDLALVPDYPQSLKDGIIEYRNALRDFPKNLDPNWKNVEDVIWPTPPENLL